MVDDPNERGTDRSQGSDMEGLAAAPELRRASGYAQNLAGFVLFVGVVLMLVGVGLVGYQLSQRGGEIAVLVSDPYEVFQVDAELPEGTTLDISEVDGVALQVDELPPALRALTRLPELVTGIIFLVGAVLARRILLEVAAGRPFSPAVPGRLAGLALTVVAGALLPGAAASLATVVVLEHVGDAVAGGAIGFTILALDLIPLVLAAGLGIAAAVFRHGRRLTDDVQGLV